MREDLNRGADLPADGLTVLIEYLDEDRVSYLFPVNALAELYIEVGSVVHIMEGPHNTATLTVETIDAPAGSQN
ncbi:hypothetical protein EYE40_05425 [Glaciihabitans arcticus]|uniref:Uncharacterized protein n=1 Tax=Glaciihabitans arcticus TaxID=2668039 RepID=A0A4Q9GPY5_9MICO|nr:hypothetical protein [Glaciihabitans arcticus]TBN56886.1 hypothetical protein EYE40_05425 [Glaciihabitans arcticus]